MIAILLAFIAATIAGYLLPSVILPAIERFLSHTISRDDLP
jgi:hypothetical protein